MRSGGRPFCSAATGAWMNTPDKTEWGALPPEAPRSLHAPLRSSDILLVKIYLQESHLPRPEHSEAQAEGSGQHSNRALHLAPSSRCQSNGNAHQHAHGHHPPDGTHSKNQDGTKCQEHGGNGAHDNQQYGGCACQAMNDAHDEGPLSEAQSVVLMLVAALAQVEVQVRVCIAIVGVSMHVERLCLPHMKENPDPQEDQHATHCKFHELRQSRIDHKTKGHDCEPKDQQ